MTRDGSGCRNLPSKYGRADWLLLVCVGKCHYLVVHQNTRHGLTNYSMATRVFSPTQVFSGLKRQNALESLETVGITTAKGVGKNFDPSIT